MVKTFGESADFTAFKVVDGYIYRVAWAKTIQVEKAGNGKVKESPLCDYMLERYDYKPSMDLVLNDILASGEQASMEEIREISEGLGAEPLWYMKKAMLAYIEKYDASSSVNSFLLNGESHWLDFNLRDRVFQGNERLKLMGRTDTTLWLDGMCIEFPIEQAQMLIANIEAYAKDCYNVTERHKAEVKALKTYDDVMAYDITADYPDKIELNISETNIISL